MNPITISILLSIVAILLILYKVSDKLSGILKDQSNTDGTKPFSLSRTLFCLWTVLMLFAFCYIGIATQKLPTVTKGMLLLMGIAAGTSLVGRAIDNIQSADASLKRIQDTKSDGFWKDLLTDQNGISISRIQALCFNLVYAAIFVGTVINNQQVYPFDEMTLTLLGISSGAYAMLKIPEAQPK